MTAVDTFPDVAKSDKHKSGSGKHKKARQPVQFPLDWLKVAQERARQNKRPTIWYLIDILKADAEASGMKDLPPAPWEGSPGESAD